MTQGYARANKEVQIWYETFGDPSDEAIVLGHPGASDALFWADEFCQLLADGNRFVIRYDTRDCGMSTHLNQYGTDWKQLLNDPPYSWEDMASDAVGLLDHLNIPQAHFVGLSSGSVISNYVALNNPDRVSSLTMMGTWLATHGQDDAESRRRAVDLLAFDFLAIPPEGREEKIATATKLVRATCGLSYPFDEDRDTKWAVSAVDRGLDFFDVRRSYMANINAEPRLARLSTMQAPLLVIHGMDDTFAKMDDALMLAAMVPNGQFLLVAGLGHQVPEGAYGLLSTAILRHTRGERIHS